MPDTDSIDIEQTLHRVCSEYLEMPGLRLTRPQAQRLWGLDQRTCEQLLGALVEVGFLQHTANDTYARKTDGPTPYPRMRMARAAFERVPAQVAARR